MLSEICQSERQIPYDLTYCGILETNIRNKKFKIKALVWPHSGQDPLPSLIEGSFSAMCQVVGVEENLSGDFL